MTSVENAFTFEVKFPPLLVSYLDRLEDDLYDHLVTELYSKIYTEIRNWIPSGHFWVSCVKLQSGFGVSLLCSISGESAETVVGMTAEAEMAFCDDVEYHLHAELIKKIVDLNGAPDLDFVDLIRVQRATNLFSFL